MASGWTYEQTRALISIWGQEDVQRELDGVARNRIIYQRMSSELSVEKTGSSVGLKSKI